MTDPHDPMDDLLRGALADEAADVEADDTLLARIRTADASPSSARRSRVWLVAAVLLLVAGTVGVLAQRRTDDRHATPPVAPSPSSTTTTPTTTSTTIADPLKDRPVVVAIVTMHKRVVLVDLATGQQTELATYDDLSTTSTIPDGNIPVTVDLAPDGDYVYFSTCCEPVFGFTYRVPVTGGPPEFIAEGSDVRVSPDGRYVATAGGGLLRITPTPETGGDPVELRTEEGPGRLAWSPNSDELSYRTSQPGTGSNPQIHTIHWDGAKITPIDPGKPDNPGEFVIYSPDAIPTVQLGEPVADDLSWSQDRTARWTIVVDEDGTVRWLETVGGSPEDLVGVPKAVSADW